MNKSPLKLKYSCTCATFFTMKTRLFHWNKLNVHTAECLCINEQSTLWHAPYRHCLEYARLYTTIWKILFANFFKGLTIDIIGYRLSSNSLASDLDPFYKHHVRLGKIGTVRSDVLFLLINLWRDVPWAKSLRITLSVYAILHMWSEKERFFMVQGIDNFANNDHDTSSFHIIEFILHVRAHNLDIVHSFPMEKIHNKCLFYQLSLQIEIHLVENSSHNYNFAHRYNSSLFFQSVRKIQDIRYSGFAA